MRKLVKDNEAEALRILFKRTNTKFSKQSIKELKAHPFFPSLLSMNAVLDNLNIDNVTLRATYEELQNDFPKPLLVSINDNGGMYLVVDSLDDEKIHFVNEKGELESQKKEEFLRTWSGIALLVDSESEVREKNYKLNIFRDIINSVKLPIGFLSIIMMLYYSMHYGNNYLNLYDYLFLSTKLLGLIVSVPLMVQLIDKHNLFVKKLCNSSNSTSKVNCSSILDSPAASFLGIFSWSEVGFLYFSSLFFYIVLIQGHSIEFIVFQSLLVGVYPIYSIYYQWRIVKKWCRLCLLTQAVLVLDIVISIIFIQNTSISIAQISGKAFVGWVLVLLVITILYSFIKPVLMEWKAFKGQMPKLRRVKLDPEVFSILLKREPPIILSGVAPLQFGNPDAEIVITIISNPTCVPCINMHQKLFQFLKKKKNVLVNEIFLTDTNNQDSGFRMAKYMVELYLSEGSDRAKEAFEEYYANYSTYQESWMNLPPQKISSESYKMVINHINWCLERHITSTPKIFLNGHQLPEAYSIEDLDYLID